MITFRKKRKRPSLLERRASLHRKPGKGLLTERLTKDFQKERARRSRKGIKSMISEGQARRTGGAGEQKEATNGKVAPAGESQSCRRTPQKPCKYRSCTELEK